MRFGVAVVAALGLLALPGSAFAHHSIGCPAPDASDKSHTQGTTTVTVYDDPSQTSGSVPPPLPAGGGVCVYDSAGVIGFHGGILDAGVGEDPAGISPNDPDGLDFYAVVDGDDTNTAGGGQSKGYVGLSSWESGGAGVKESDCNTDDDTPLDDPVAPPPAELLPNVDRDDDAAPSHNSGGCVSVRSGGVVVVSVPVPFVVCGNTTGSRWDGGSTRDGCTVP
jgi:hypothetical protein